MSQRPDVPLAMVERIRAILDPLPDVREDAAWVGVRWTVGRATVAHVFGGEDQLFRIIFHAEPDEVMAFAHLGDPYFKTEWGRDVVGLLLDDAADWVEVGELLTDSYCIQAPATHVERVERPG